MTGVSTRRQRAVIWGTVVATCAVVLAVRGPSSVTDDPVTRYLLGLAAAAGAVAHATLVVWSRLRR